LEDEGIDYYGRDVNEKYEKSECLVHFLVGVGEDRGLVWEMRMMAERFLWD
jgi:hypothetical protein